MYHPVPSSFFFLERQDLWDFCHLVPYKKKKSVWKKKRHKAAKFGISPTGYPGFWHNHEPKHPERALWTSSWLGQSWSFFPSKTNIGDQRRSTWVRTLTFAQGFVGVFGSILVRLLMERQLARAMVLVNLCSSFGWLGGCKCFETWRADAQC